VLNALSHRVAISIHAKRRAREEIAPGKRPDSRAGWRAARAIALRYGGDSPKQAFEPVTAEGEFANVVRHPQHASRVRSPEVAAPR